MSYFNHLGSTIHIGGECTDAVLDKLIELVDDLGLGVDNDEVGEVFEFYEEEASTSTVEEIPGFCEEYNLTYVIDIGGGEDAQWLYWWTPGMKESVDYRAGDGNGNPVFSEKEIREYIAERDHRFPATNFEGAFDAFFDAHRPPEVPPLTIVEPDLTTI